MPTKAEQYAQMADQVARQLTGSWQEWAGFLTTAARLYKYPFHEQMMIYAQRPDATACAEYDLWNNRMGRYVRRGSKGIALVDDSGDRPRLRYVFDISDTGTREHSRTPWLWTMNEEHAAPVMAMLESSYGVGGEELPQQLADVAAGLAEEYWTDHWQDILYSQNKYPPINNPCSTSDAKLSRCNTSIRMNSSRFKQYGAPTRPVISRPYRRKY